MATGPEHYQAAESLIEKSVREDGTVKDDVASKARIALAQVHATLAQAAAVAMTSEASDADFAAWDEVAGVQPIPGNE